MLKLLVLLTLLGLGLTMEGVVELTDASFKEKVYAQPQLWLVMFSASWVLPPPFSADTAPNSSQR